MFLFTNVETGKFVSVFVFLTKNCANCCLNNLTFSFFASCVWFSGEFKISLYRVVCVSVSAEWWVNLGERICFCVCGGRKCPSGVRVHCFFVVSWYLHTRKWFTNFGILFLLKIEWNKWSLRCFLMSPRWTGFVLQFVKTFQNFEISSLTLFVSSLCKA